MLKRKSFWFTFALIFLTLSWPFLFGFGLGSALIGLADGGEEPVGEYEFVRGDEFSENSILVIEISGPILDKSPDIFSPIGLVTFGYDVKETLMEAAEKDEVKAIMFEISSPGGTVTGSRAIADGVEYFREKSGKPVYGFGTGLVASGAYWVISAADQVWIDPGSLVGSIGVIGGQFPVYDQVTELGNGLLGPIVGTEGGIDVVTITSGEGKDLGNPFREPTEKEIGILQSSSDEAYQGFVDHVVATRGLSQVAVRDQVGAYIYGEGQAQALGLVDQLGNREIAYAALAEALGVGNDYKIVRTELEIDFLTRFLGVASSLNPLSAETPKACSLSQRVLAYHGSLVELCNSI